MAKLEQNSNRKKSLKLTPFAYADPASASLSETPMNTRAADLATISTQSTKHPGSKNSIGYTVKPNLPPCNKFQFKILCTQSFDKQNDLFCPPPVFLMIPSYKLYAVI